MTGVIDVPRTHSHHLQPVICVTENQYRDEGIARDAVRGRFHHLGTTCDLGRRPDWLAPPVSDVEWRIEWIKMYEGLHLAHTYARTGDHELLATWEDMVESFCDQVPVGYDTSDVSARRLQNWLYAWQAFAASPHFGGLRDTMEEWLPARIRADAVHLAAHLTAGRNHRTLELYTLLLVGIALDDHERAADALRALADNAARDIWADGVHRECSTDYHLIVLRSFLGAIANAEAAGLSVPPALTERAGLACDVALHLTGPDGVTPAISDGDEGDWSDLFLLAAGVLDRPDLEWLASRGRRGAPPTERLASFPIGGYFVQRSGWGDRGRPIEDERWAVFDCGPIGDGGHGHYDQLSLVASAGGRALLVDPGRYTYEPESPWRRWFKGTAGHNTVCVDGLDQTPFRPGKPRATSSAVFLGRFSTPGLDILRGEVRSPAYDALHVRTVVFVDDDYWLVHDRLRAPSSHRYETRWHLPSSAHGSVVTSDVGGQHSVRLPGGQLIIAAGPDVAIEEGWVSPTYGTKLAAPIVVAASVGADADVLTAVVPGDAGTVLRWATLEGRIRVTITRPDRQMDVVTLESTSVGATLERLPW
jgi:hypothetical protein